MSSAPKISIIIPCYNREKYIGESIDSALAQHYENKEIVVINDGSTDASGDIIGSYGNMVSSVCTNKRGVSAARNTGIWAANGEYITFLDSDDKLKPECLSTFASRQLTLNTILVSRTHTIDMRGCFTDLNTYELSEYPSHGNFPKLQIVAELNRNVGCLIPRCLLLRIRCYDETISLGEDYDVNLRLLDAGAEFCPVSGNLYQARIHQEDRLSKNISTERYHRVADIFEERGSAGKSSFGYPRIRNGG